MSSKLSFLEGEAHEMNLGLSDGNYLTISNTVDAVIHNAWNLGKKRFQTS
jgi:thioester reductase-like protein